MFSLIFFPCAPQGAQRNHWSAMRDIECRQTPAAFLRAPLRDLDRAPDQLRNYFAEPHARSFCESNRRFVSIVVERNGCSH